MGRHSSLALLAAMGLAAAAMAACNTVIVYDGPDINPPVFGADGGGGAASSTAPATVTTTTAGGAGGQGGAGGEGGRGEACATVSHETTLGKKPADIIFVIDNSGSMSEEIDSVEANINVNFAQIIGASDVDYRVIMVTAHGSDQLNVCVAPPLSGTTDCNGPPVAVAGQFYHYSLGIGSHDSLCKALDGMYGTQPDAWGLAPNGYNDWLRASAVKIWVEISDDTTDCAREGVAFDDNDDIQQGKQVAIDWDHMLLGMNATQFGSTQQRNYLFYSIVGMPSKTDLTPYGKDEPVQTGICPGGVAAGTAYQWLSKGTAALRFPVCSYQSYDAVFNDIAAGVIEVTAVPCEWDMPEPEPGEIYDYETLEISYTAGGMGEPLTFMRVSGPTQCSAGAFYLDGEHVVLCPEACDTVRGDVSAELEANVWCE